MQKKYNSENIPNDEGSDKQFASKFPTTFKLFNKQNNLGIDVDKFSIEENSKISTPS